MIDVARCDLLVDAPAESTTTPAADFRAIGFALVSHHRVWLRLLVDPPPEHVVRISLTLSVRKRARPGTAVGISVFQSSRSLSLASRPCGQRSVRCWLGGDPPGGVKPPHHAIHMLRRRTRSFSQRARRAIPESLVEADFGKQSWGYCTPVPMRASARQPGGPVPRSLETDHMLPALPAKRLQESKQARYRSDPATSAWSPLPRLQQASAGRRFCARHSQPSS